jgi:hypothetical protein
MTPASITSSTTTIPHPLFCTFRDQIVIRICTDPVSTLILRFFYVSPMFCYYPRVVRICCYGLCIDFCECELRLSQSLRGGLLESHADGMVIHGIPYAMCSLSFLPWRTSPCERHVCK